MKTLIIGKRSFLSKKLSKKIKDSKIISTNDFLKFNSKKISNLVKDKKYNIIINSFFPSQKIPSIDNYSEFVLRSLIPLSKILDNIAFKKINKIIYSSSSSIYFQSYEFRNNKKHDLYSLAKILSENILKTYSKKNKVSIVIARIFNIYGDEDEHSIVSKIIESYNKKKRLYLYNNGQSIRDFINVEDVVTIYKKILKSSIQGDIDVGTGYGIKIKDIIQKLKKRNFIIKNIKIDEQDRSIAKISRWKKKIKVGSLTNLEKYLIQRLKLNRSLKLKKY